MNMIGKYAVVRRDSATFGPMRATCIKIVRETDKSWFYLQPRWEDDGERRRAKFANDVILWRDTYEEAKALQDAMNAEMSDMEKQAMERKRAILSKYTEC